MKDEFLYTSKEKYLLELVKEFEEIVSEGSKEDLEANFIQI